MKTCIESISVQHRQTFDIQMLIYTCRFDIVSIEGSRYLYADIFARLSLRCRKTCVDLISMQHRQIFYVQMLIYRFDIVSIEGSRYLYADIYTIVTTQYQHIISIQNHVDIGFPHFIDIGRYWNCIWDLFWYILRKLHAHSNINSVSRARYLPFKQARVNLSRRWGSR